jgi:metallo-beta-lactamase family protein
LTKIKFCGAAREVTGSMHLVQKDNFNVLLDCGMEEGKRKESFERNSHFPFDPASINTLILSHAHIDHSGNIPTLIKQGFNGLIHATGATKGLCDLMLPDSAHVQLRDLEYVNKRRAKQGKVLFEPLYTETEAVESIKYFQINEIDERFSLTNGIEVEFLNAGHILGSCMMVISIKENGRTIKLAFTGDLGRKNLPMLQDPDGISDIDYLIIESTYGGKDHKDIALAYDRVAEVINETYAKGGKVIIPVFAVERTQEVLFVLNKLFIQKKIPSIKIFVDSPLAVAVTELFEKHEECFDKEMIYFLNNGEGPFTQEMVQYVKTVEESKAINDFKGRCVILSATGMCEAGRILHHLKNNITDAKNTVMIVGYQAENTLGRRLVDGAKLVKIFGEEYQVNAKIEVINEFSGHAGSSGLVDFIKNANSERLKKIFLVHGEPKQQEKLMARLNAAGIYNVMNPELGYESEL